MAICVRCGSSVYPEYTPGWIYWRDAGGSHKCYRNGEMLHSNRIDEGAIVAIFATRGEGHRFQFGWVSNMLLLKSEPEPSVAERLQSRLDTLVQRGILFQDADWYGLTQVAWEAIRIYVRGSRVAKWKT